MAGIYYDLKKLDKTMTMEVRITREFRVRYWIATRLLRLASVVLGMRFDIVYDDNLDQYPDTHRCKCALVEKEVG